MSDHQKIKELFQELTELLTPEIKQNGFRNLLETRLNLPELVGPAIMFYHDFVIATLQVLYIMHVGKQQMPDLEGFHGEIIAGLTSITPNDSFIKGVNQAYIEAMAQKTPKTNNNHLN